MFEEKNVRAYLAWIAICIIWGTTYLAIRIGVKDLPPLLLAGFRFIIAGPVLYFLLRLKGFEAPRRDEIFPIAVVGISLLAIGNGMLVLSEKYIPSGLTALLFSTLPFWVVAIEAALPKGKKLNLKIAAGLVLGIIGVFIILGADPKNLFNSNYFLGVIAIMIGVIGWSSGSVYSKYKKTSVHPLMNASVQMIIAGVVLNVVALFLGEFSVLHFTLEGTAALVYLIIFGSLIGYSCYIYAVAHLPVSFVSTYAYVNPVIALFLGWLVLREEITVNLIIAAAIILVGVMLVKKGNEIKTTS